VSGKGVFLSLTLSNAGRVSKFFTDGLRSKFVTGWSNSQIAHYTSTTLPCDIFMPEEQRFLTSPAHSSHRRNVVHPPLQWFEVAERYALSSTTFDHQGLVYNTDHSVTFRSHRRDYNWSKRTVRNSLNMFRTRNRQAVVSTCRGTPVTAAGSTAEGCGIPAMGTSNRAPWRFS